MNQQHAFQHQLLQWAQQHGRHDLPWQREPNPYHVWLSETMLQQTQVSTVIPYFEAFIKAFPKIQALADASLDQVLRLWSGLGYYARAKRLHATAQIITHNDQGQWPQEIDALMQLPGIGRSTAGAIRALAFNLKASILDGNVKRVLCRYHGYRHDITKAAHLRQLWALADAMVPEQQARAYTQAMMDLGATCCTPHQPQCERCPVQSDCQAFQHGWTDQLPLKTTRQQPKKSITYELLMLCHQQAVLLVKRPPEGIWGDLWCLPILDSTWRPWLEQQPHNAWTSHHLPPFKHVLTHRHLWLKPRVMLLNEPPTLPKVAYFWYKLNSVLKQGIPKPIHTLLQQVSSHGTANFLSKAEKRSARTA